MAKIAEQAERYDGKSSKTPKKFFLCVYILRLTLLSFVIEMVSYMKAVAKVKQEKLSSLQTHMRTYTHIYTHTLLSSGRV